MHRFKFLNGYNTYSLDIDDYKFLIGNNYEIKYEIYRTLKAQFAKIGNSEFAVENNNKHMALCDEKALDNKQWRFFEVTPFFELEADMKMGTKSLLGKYLESIGDFLEQNEFYNTLQILLNSLNDEFFDHETKVDIGDKELKLQIGDITKSNIAKEIYPQISGNGFECNFADLSYEEIILFQLNIIEKILNKTSKDINTIIYCNLPYLTSKILLSLYGLSYENTFTIIDTPKAPKVSIEKVGVSGDIFLDFANDEMILDKIMDFPFHTSKEEVRESVSKYINSRENEITNRSIIEIFFEKI